MKNWTSRIAFTMLSASLIFSLSGCLTSSYFFMARYDDAKDEFAIMNLNEQIAAGSPGDSKYLHNLWLNRDCIIQTPLGFLAYVRLSSNRYADISLWQAPGKVDAKETGISLDKIRVMPGKFFLRDPDTLCYYDQIVIPGTVVDQALACFPKAMAPGLIESIDVEVKRRREGGKRAQWNDILTIEQLHAAPFSAPKPGEPNPADPLQVLDDESLQRLRRGVTDGSMKFTRDKEVFRVVFPMSDADAVQYEKLAQAIGQAIAAAEKEPVKNAQYSPAAAAKILSAFAVTPRPHAVELKIDLAIVLKNLTLLSDPLQPLGDPKPPLQAMRDAITDLRAHGVPIDDKTTVEQLARDFTAGALKTYSVDKPVEPGAGLAQPDSGLEVRPKEPTETPK